MSTSQACILNSAQHSTFYVYFMIKELGGEANVRKPWPHWGNRRARGGVVGGWDPAWDVAGCYCGLVLTEETQARPALCPQAGAGDASLCPRSCHRPTGLSQGQPASCPLQEAPGTPGEGPLARQWPHCLVKNLGKCSLHLQAPIFYFEFKLLLPWVESSL